MRKNLWLKIGSLLLAIIVWFSVITKVQSSVTLEVPLRLKNIPSDFEPVYASENVIITISGPERLIRNLDTSQIEVNLDMTKAKKGMHIYTIDEKAVSLPAFMRIVDINPHSVTVDLEEKVRKTVPIKVSLSGRPKKGYRVFSVETDPEEAEVVGAASRIQGVSHLETEPVDISNAADTIRTDVKLLKPEGLSSIEKIKVIIKISESRAR